MISALILSLVIQDSFKSEGPLEFKNIQSPTTAVQYQPVEITIDLGGTWNNAFDPKQIDVSAYVVGPENIAAEVPGFLYASPGNKPVWKIRFSPWAAGGFGVNISAMDTLARIESQKLGIKVSGPSDEDKKTAGFIESLEKKPYLQRAKKGFFPIGAILSAEQASPAAFAKLKSLGANFCVMAVTSGLEPKLGIYDMAKFAKLEELLDSAKANGIYVMLTLAGRDWLENWKTNTYNRANGGPCEKTEDFWTDLQARIAYKKFLRYLIARLNSNSALAGVQFFTGVEAPDYWVDEMSDEVVALHPFGIPVTTESRLEGVFKSEKLNVVTSDLKFEGANRPETQTYAVIHGLSLATKKPVLITNLPDGLSTRSLLWWQVISGAAGAFTKGIPAENIYQPLADFSTNIDWYRRKFESRQVFGSGDTAGWGLIDDNGGPVYIETAGAIQNSEAKAQAGQASLALKRGGKYKFTWYSTATGEKLTEGEVQDKDKEITFPYPAFKQGIACLLERK